jgi:hypothetical protein
MAKHVSITLASGGRILRKEDKTMTYNKPEVTVLGDARLVIAKTGKAGISVDGAHVNPAYDLDE